MKNYCILLSGLLVFIWSYPSGADLSGKITDSAGVPAAGARVFVEPGIEGSVIEGRVNADGAFTVEGEFYGNTGIIALSPGLGYGGVHLSVSPGSQIADLNIILRPAASISGQVVDEKGVPQKNARLVAAAITEPVKVGIPLFKMTQYGVSVPVSDQEGRFTLEGVPEGSKVALKFEHAFYAQEAVADVSAGEDNLRVVLYNGVSLRGAVIVRGTATPVSGAVVTIRNAQPPHDTAYSSTDNSGAFRSLLKPGVYLVQAYSAGRISPGLQRVELRGDLPEQQVRLALSQKGAVTGVVNDAKSGEPIEGVRVLLETQGQAAGATRTGTDGRFRLDAPEGPNVVHIEGMEGYLPPESRSMQITVPGGKELALPGLWLAPKPEYKLRVLEADGTTPVSGAFISLLWPRQFGWQRSDKEGCLAIRFGALPSDNRVIGFAEHPDKPLGALFLLQQNTADRGEVALLPLAEVSGRVVNSKGMPVAGATVGSFYADDDSPEALALWRCVTGRDGAFRWPAAPAGAPQRCIASIGAVQGSGDKDINPAPGESIDLGEITLETETQGDSATPENWADLPHNCGPEADMKGARGTAAFCCRAAEGPVYLDAVAAMREQLRFLNMEALVIMLEPFDCAGASVPVYRADTGMPTTRLYAPGGQLKLETVGLPPIRAMQQLVLEK